MGLLRFLGFLLASLLATAAARRRRGPLLPSWSFGFEVITRAQKRFNASLAPLPPVEQRRLWGALKARSPALEAVNVREQTLAGVRTFWFEPKAGASSTVVLYLHGGAFIYGSERSHGDLAARLALATGARVGFPIYRLAPEHPFPAAADDVRQVFDALADDVGAGRVIVAGDSAGGNLALTLVLGLRDAGKALPRAVVPISPWVDLTARGGSLDENQRYDWAEPEQFESWARTYLARGEDPKRPDISPAYADLRNLPPLFVLIGSAEMLYDQVHAFVEKARAAGVAVTLHTGEDMVHLWLTHAPLFPSCQLAIDAIGDFVRTIAGPVPAEAAARDSGTAELGT
jgi:epsilon-lactone hydrolase